MVEFRNQMNWTFTVVLNGLWGLCDIYISKLGKTTRSKLGKTGRSAAGQTAFLETLFFCIIICQQFCLGVKTIHARCLLGLVFFIISFTIQIANRWGPKDCYFPMALRKIGRLKLLALNTNTILYKTRNDKYLTGFHQTFGVVFRPLEVAFALRTIP